MKRIVLPLLFICIGSMAFGQTLKKANSYLADKNIEKAKAELDAYLAKKPDDTEGIYLKSKIYGIIADSAAIRNLVSGDARAEAFEAFKKAYADSANMKLKLSIMQDNFQPIFKLYAGYYADAAAAFNAAAGAQSKAGFADAMNYFIKSDEIGQFLGTNNIAKIGKVDSMLVLNIGKAALNAGNEAKALEYFTKIADANINGTGGQEDESFKVPYQWLTLHYKQANDDANMLKYSAKGNKLFPKDDYYDFVLMDYYREKKDMPSLFKKSAELTVKNPDSINYHFNYANDIFGYIYNSDEGVVVENKEGLLKTLHSELEKAYKLDANNINTNWLFAQYNYNNGIEARDEAQKIKGTKPEDVKKKADINEQAKANFNAAVPYAQKAISQLEASGLKADKSRYKSIVNLMQNIYQSVGDKTNLKIYQDKYDAADNVMVK
ncbi:MAG: hypothetical protein ABIP35_05335 [Ginsengibacter sp.]